MDALTTVRAVLEWANWPRGEPPTGPLWKIEVLGTPDQLTRAALARAISATGARLGVGRPPLGDATPASLYPLLLAAAIGARREPAHANTLLDLTPRLQLTPRAGWAEGLARHAVVGAAVAALSSQRERGAAVPDAPPDQPALVDRLLAASPLTTVLHHPASASADTSFRAAMSLLARPRGAAVLTGVLATPSDDHAVLAWRARLLEHLRQENLARLLDVYTAARLWHGPAWDELARAAGAEISRGRGVTDRTVATLRYWLPLAKVEQQEQRALGIGEAIRGRRPAPAPGGTIAGRRSLRRTDYELVVGLAERHRRSLEAGGT